ELLLRAKSIDPGGPWARQLGMLYAHVIVGSDGDAWTTGGGNRAANVTEAHSPYALEIRKKLSESTDDKLLSEAGQFLTIYLDRVSGLDFDPRSLGVSYLERALQLNPQSTQAHAILVSMRRSARLQSEGVKFGDDSHPDVVASFPPDKRFDSLPELVQWSFMR